MASNDGGPAVAAYQPSFPPFCGGAVVLPQDIDRSTKARREKAGTNRRLLQ